MTKKYKAIKHTVFLCLFVNKVHCLRKASLPLSGRLVTCPWYWEYHSVEFSVPASVENLELSVPTLLVLTFCKEKTLICIGMQGKGPFVAQTVLNQNRKNTSRKFGEQVEDKNLQNTSRKLIVRKNLFCCGRKMGTVYFPPAS